MTMLEYANKFNKSGHFCPQLIEFERSKANKFEQGLRYKIQSRLSSHLFNNYKDVLEWALKVKQILTDWNMRGIMKRYPNLQKFRMISRKTQRTTLTKTREQILVGIMIEIIVGLILRNLECVLSAARRDIWCEII